MLLWTNKNIKLSNRILKRGCIFLFAFLIVFFPSTSILAQTETTKTTPLPFSLKESELYAKSALLMDASNGRVLYEKDGYKQLPMASTTKIMTCIYTLEHGNLDDTVTISKNAANQPRVRLGMREGEQFKLRDLLYALMLESYNDCAVAIAEHLGGSVEQFCYDMSNKARDLGAYYTNFETPNGLDSQNHYTTSYDLALITKYAIDNEQFCSIINTRSHTFTELTKGTSHSVYNKDAFLDQYEGAFGVKTGFTGNAGYCFVGAAKREDKTFISVVLASGWPPNKTYKWSDTKKLMDYGFKNYEYQEIGIEHPKLEKIPVLDGQKPFLSLYTDAKKERLLLSPTEKLEVKINLPNQLEAPIKKELPVGSISYYLDGNEFRCYSVYAADSVKKIDYGYCLKKVLKRWSQGVFYEERDSISSISFYKTISPNNQFML